MTTRGTSFHFATFLFLTTPSHPVPRQIYISRLFGRDSFTVTSSWTFIPSLLGISMSPVVSTLKRIPRTLYRYFLPHFRPCLLIRCLRPLHRPSSPVGIMILCVRIEDLYPARNIPKSINNDKREKEAETTG